jgi:hypothetical protein
MLQYLNFVVAQPLGGAGMKEPGILVSFDRDTHFASLLPSKKLLLDCTAKGYDHNLPQGILD